MPRRTPTSQEQPTKEQILNYIEKTTGHVSKRDIARAFQLSGPDRIWLKSVLKELEEEGQLERHRGWRVSRSGRLPEVTVIRVSHVDEEGEVVAKPISWPEGAGDPPTIYLSAVRRRGLAPGIGDRVLARLSHTGDGTYELVMEPVGAINGLPPAVYGIVFNPHDKSERPEFIKRIEPLWGPGALYEERFIGAWMASDEQLKSATPAELMEKQGQLQEIYEGRIASLQRLVSFLVMFHAMLTLP